MGKSLRYTVEDLTPCHLLCFTLPWTEFFSNMCFLLVFTFCICDVLNPRDHCSWVVQSVDHSFIHFSTWNQKSKKTFVSPIFVFKSKTKKCMTRFPILCSNHKWKRQITRGDITFWLFHLTCHLCQIKNTKMFYECLSSVFSVFDLSTKLEMGKWVIIPFFCFGFGNEWGKKDWFFCFLSFGFMLKRINEWSLKPPVIHIQLLTLSIFASSYTLHLSYGCGETW